MTNRLRLGLASGVAKFRVSAPGVDVDSATFLQTLFDIDYGVYSGVFASGNAPFDGSWTVTGSNSFYGSVITYTKTIMFGKTFNSIPKVGLSVNDPYLGTSYFGPRYSVGVVSFDNIGGSGLHGSNVQCTATAQVDRMAIVFQRLYYDGTAASFPASAGYVIFHG